MLDLDDLHRWVWTGLSADQNDARACVVCSAPVAVPARMVSFVGVNNAGSVVWACTTGCAPTGNAGHQPAAHRSTAPTRGLLLVRPTRHADAGWPRAPRATLDEVDGIVDP